MKLRCDALTQRMFREARALSPVERADYLDNACRHDADLRVHLEALFAEDTREHLFLDDPLIDSRWLLATITRPDGAGTEHSSAGANASPAVGALLLDRYTLGSELGRGSMGIVHEAEDLVLGRRVAIKILSVPPRVGAGDTDPLADFAREAKFLAALNHANIATLYSFEKTRECCFLVMELVSGKTLAERLDEGAIPVDEAMSFGIQIARALEHAHRAGTTHGDLKPSNVRLTLDGSIKVLDFGLARSPRGSPTGRDFEDSGCGTVGYLSPEQLRGSAADEKSDLWGFGAVLFECFARDPAFGGGTRGEVIARTLVGEPAWNELPAAVPEPIVALLRKCLNKSPTERCVTATSIRQCLEDQHALRSYLARHRGPSEEDDTTAIPRYPTSFVGRESELMRLAELVAEERWITLTGPAGAGKTRLAVELARKTARAFVHGACMARFVAVTDDRFVASTLATALGIDDARAAPPEEAIVRRLRDQRMLLVMDNCEHWRIACAGLVTRILERCPGVHVLVTSRERLGPAGERVFHVSPLPVPEEAGVSVERLRKNDALRLLLDRLESADRRWEITAGNAPQLARLCRRLDGLPLALELAAGSIPLLGLDDIEARLDLRLDTLRNRDPMAEPHHATLRAVLDWSCERLSREERILFARLAVFGGGFTLALAEDVCSGEEIAPQRVLDLLMRLVARSLVGVDAPRPVAGRATRYRLLETVRIYAREQLSQSDMRLRLEERFRRRMCALVKEARKHLDTAESTRCIDSIDEEETNIHEALATRGENHVLERLDLAVNVAYFWYRLGKSKDIELVLGHLLEDRAGSCAGHWGMALAQLALVAKDRGATREAYTLAEDGLRISEAANDPEAIATLCANLGQWEKTRGDFTAARAYLRRALHLFEARDKGCLEHPCLPRYALAYIDLLEGDFAAAEAAALAICACESSGHVACASALLWRVAMIRSDFAAARRHAEDAIARARMAGSRKHVALGLVYLGTTAIAERRFADARETLVRGLNLAQELGRGTDIWFARNALALLAVEEGNGVSARAHVSEGLTVAALLGHSKDIEVVVRTCARTLLLEPRGASTAAWLHGAAHALRKNTDYKVLLPDDARRLTADRERACAAIGEEAWQREWDAGAAAQLEQILERARRALAERGIAS